MLSKFIRKYVFKYRIISVHHVLTGVTHKMIQRRLFCLPLWFDFHVGTHEGSRAVAERRLQQYIEKGERILFYD